MIIYTLVFPGKEENKLQWNKSNIVIRNQLQNQLAEQLMTSYC